MIVNNLLDFSKLFFPLKKHSELYNNDYALKADSHAQNEISKDEMNWVAEKCKMKARILDIGCNTGRPLNYLTSLLNSKVGQGVDINSSAIKLARNNFPSLDFSIYDGFQLPIADSSFDHVVIHHVIGHVQSPDIILNEAYRVLAVGGSISIVTPNWWYKFFQFPINLYRFFNPDLTILRYYSNNKLRKSLENARFTSIEIDNIGPCPSWINFEFSRLRVIAIAYK